MTTLAEAESGWPGRRYASSGPPSAAKRVPTPAGGELQVHVSDMTAAGDMSGTTLAAVADGVLAALTSEGVAAAHVEAECVDDDRMRADNRRWLDHDWTTDVLSFSLGGEGTPGRELAGCLEINPNYAARSAPEHLWPPHELPAATRELMLYAVHGTLHLCWYDDASDAERAEMRRAEAAALAACGVAVPAGHCR